MKPEKVTCPNCEASEVNDSKHRGRFLRRHLRDNVCGNYARKQAEVREAEDLKKRIAEGTKTDGTRVDMSGDAGLAQQVAAETLPGGVA